MSDLVLGTIIGGAIGVLASLLGSIVQGYWSSKNTVTQIRHEKESTITERLIVRREKYLNPISEAMSECYQYTMQISDKLIESLVEFKVTEKGSSEQKVLVTVENKEKFEHVINYIGEILEKLHKINEKIELQRSINTDEVLEKMLREVFLNSTTFYRMHIGININFINLPIGENYEYDFNLYIEKLLYLQIDLQKINKRIEQLLCGIEED